jgi:hypothetical protein
MMYGSKLSRICEMDPQFIETNSGHSPRLSAPYGAHHHAPTNHQRAEEAQRNHNKSERRTLTGHHS